MLSSLRNLLLTLTLLALPCSVLAQTMARPQTILDALEQTEPGQGTVTLLGMPSLRSFIGHARPSSTSRGTGSSGARIQQGWRIQVLNSNLPNAKAEAYSRAEKVRAVDPTLGCYVAFRSPFWRLTVGDFTSQEEANRVRRQLVKVLPAWARDAYIVRDRVRVSNTSTTNDTAE